MILVVPAIMVLVFLLSARSFSGSPATQDKNAAASVNSHQTTAGTAVTSQSDNKTKSAKKSSADVYDKVDVYPEYPGGAEAMYNYIMTNLKYPEAAKTNKVQGKVVVSFNIMNDGAVSDVKALQGIGSGCDEEAIRVVSKMPKWKPGEKDGKIVNVHMVLPLQFKLDAGKKEEPR